MLLQISYYDLAVGIHVVCVYGSRYSLAVFLCRNSLPLAHNAQHSTSIVCTCTYTCTCTMGVLGPRIHRMSTNSFIHTCTCTYLSRSTCSTHPYWDVSLHANQVTKLFSNSWSLIWSESRVCLWQFLSHPLLKPVQLDGKLVESIILFTVRRHGSCRCVYTIYVHVRVCVHHKCIQVHMYM